MGDDDVDVDVDVNVDVDVDGAVEDVHWARAADRLQVVSLISPPIISIEKFLEAKSDCCKLYEDGQSTAWMTFQLLFLHHSSSHSPHQPTSNQEEPWNLICTQHTQP